MDTLWQLNYSYTFAIANLRGKTRLKVQYLPLTCSEASGCMIWKYIKWKHSGKTQVPRTMLSYTIDCKVKS